MTGRLIPEGGVEDHLARRGPHRRGRPQGALLVACLLGALLASGCGSATDAEARVRAALARTERLSHRFIYSEDFKDEKAPRKTVVRGLVEDDFRYKARVFVAGREVLDEVVSDDALAVRFAEPARIADFARRPKVKRGGAGVGAEALGAGARVEVPAAPDAPFTVAIPGSGPALEALGSRRWVLDPAGAPAIFGSADDERRLGEDPVLDALDAFAYAERAIDEAIRVVEFNEESLEYRRSEDPFPRPARNSGVIRYDFIPPELPKAAHASPGGNQVTPGTRHFRKLSVYVKGGRVVQIREAIDVESRLEDLSEIYETKFPKDRKPSEVAAIAVEALNVIRTGQGEDPIRLRTMS
ncbi:MAG: hypothetical protein L0027_08690, partial [Candidatus Rokubacteria bacterium]|nr:hypothetical protein [Candidatus Rokubacteria bacterium]